MSNNQSQTNSVKAAPSQTPSLQDIANTDLNLKNAPNPSKPSKGKIAGIIIGIILFAVICVGVYFLVTKSKNTGKGVNWLAVGDGSNKILTSEDGINWNITEYTFPAQVNAVAYGIGNFNLPLWVATTGPDSSQESNLVYSYDGNNWLYGTGVSFDVGGRGVAYGLSSDDTTPLWVAVGGEPTNNILFSTDGLSWENATGYGTNRINSVAYGLSFNGTSGKWIAVGDQATILGSSDGQTWSSITAPPGQPSSTVDFISVAYGLSSDGNGVWVATGTSTGNSFIYSTDGGVNWNENTSGSFSSGPGLGIAFGLSSSGTSLWVGVGGYAESGSIKNSDNITNWADGDGTKFSGGGRGVAYGNNIWVAAGDGRDELLYSNDGQSWKATSGAKFKNEGLGVASKYLNPSLESKGSKLFPS